MELAADAWDVASILSTGISGTAVQPVTDARDRIALRHDEVALVQDVCNAVISCDTVSVQVGVAPLVVVLFVGPCAAVGWCVNLAHRKLFDASTRPNSTSHPVSIGWRMPTPHWWHCRKAAPSSPPLAQRSARQQCRVPRLRHGLSALHLLPHPRRSRRHPRRQWAGLPRQQPQRVPHLQVGTAAALLATARHGHRPPVDNAATPTTAWAR